MQISELNEAADDSLHKSAAELLTEIAEMESGQIQLEQQLGTGASYDYDQSDHMLLMGIVKEMHQHLGIDEG